VLGGSGELVRGFKCLLDAGVGGGGKWDGGGGGWCGVGELGLVFVVAGGGGGS